MMLTNKYETLATRQLIVCKNNSGDRNQQDIQMTKHTDDTSRHRLVEINRLDCDVPMKSIQNTIKLDMTDRNNINLHPIGCGFRVYMCHACFTWLYFDMDMHMDVFLHMHAFIICHGFGLVSTIYKVLTWVNDIEGKPLCCMLHHAGIQLISRSTYIIHNHNPCNPLQCFPGSKGIQRSLL